MHYFADQLQAASQGDPKAMFVVGLCYMSGAGVEKNELHGIAWTKQARECGFENHWNIDDFYFDKQGVWLDISEAIVWYLSQTQFGDPNDQFNLGLCFYKSEDSIFNKQQAAYYFRLAAEKKHIEALYFLAICYSYGIGLQQNMYEAIRWYNSAALGGHKGAIDCLNVLQSEGFSIST